MEDTMISIIIPVYNSQDFVGECYQSIADQTFQNYEIIFVDDGSTDKSLHILREIECNDDKVKVVSQKNSFAGVARNKGLSLAKGKYVLFLDADDFFENSMLEQIFNYAERLNADIMVFDGYLYNNRLKKVFLPTWILEQKYLDYAPEKEAFSAEEFSKYIFNFTAPSSWNKLYKRSFICKHNLQFQNTKRVNDLFFTYAALSRAERIGILNERLLYYRYDNPESLQSTREKSIYDFYEALTKLKTYLQLNNLYHRYEQSFVNLSLNRCIKVLSLTQDIDIQKDLFNRLKKDIFLNLGIIPDREEEYFYFDSYNDYMKINSHTYEEYLSLTKPYYYELSKLISENNNIIIYGAGINAVRLINEFSLDKKEDKSVDIVVSDKKSNPDSINGIKVYDRVALEDYDRNSLVIIAMRKESQKEVREYLTSLQYNKIYGYSK